MRRVTVKVCGLQAEEHIVAAAAAGVDYVGLVFAPSRRQVTPARAVQLVRSLEGMQERPQVAGVFVNESVQLVNALAADCGLDVVQLSGDESAAFCAMVASPVIRSIPVHESTTGSNALRMVRSIQSDCPGKQVFFLLDRGTGAVRGGTGESFDWSVASYVARHIPILVAGGLNSANVGPLIREVRPFGVDVSSGVERDGRKDVALVRAFVDAVRKAEEEIEDESSSCVA